MRVAVVVVMAACLLIAPDLVLGDEIADDLAALQGLASAGDAEAQVTLGNIYHEGRGVLQDFSLAVKWRRLAAAQGHAAAQNALGRHYAEGMGVQPDAQLARDFLQAAAEQGDPQHQHDLGLFFDGVHTDSPDPAKAALWYERAVDQGFVPSHANLGLLYFEGRGVAKDLKRAFSLLSTAAEQGHARAQNNLGLMYTRGEGVPQDHALAVQWFERAADQGLGPALTNLGVMYENGFGVAFDETEAKRLYRLGGQQSGHTMQSVLAAIGFPYDSRFVAIDSSSETLPTLRQDAATGDPVAQYTLAYWLTTADDTNGDFRQAARLYSAAAAKGLHSAMLNLGLLYMHGLGVPQDYVTGYMWISRSATSGAPLSIGIRDQLLPYLTAEQVNDAQKMAKK